MQSIIKNKKAFHDYTILEKYEAGIVLKGSEIKAIREKRVNIKDSFVRFIKGELFLLNAHISILSTTNAHYRHEEDGSRKLLLHKKELNKLFVKVHKDGMTIVPLELYLNNKNILKARIALAKGKALHDKREDMKKKTMQREMQQTLKNY
jgi:SsrA-binding protein